MSVDFSRLQQLAEAVGLSLTQSDGNWFSLHNAQTSTREVWCCGLTPIRARLEAEYRKLAEQAQHCLDIFGKINKTDCIVASLVAAHFTRIADELEVNEPTMVEQLKALRGGQRYLDGTQKVFCDALIDLYEREGR